VCAQFHDAVAFCWRKHDVFLRPLAHKFLKLTLQVLAKFQSWLSTLCTEKLTLSPPPPTTTSSSSVVHKGNKSTAAAAAQTSASSSTSPQPPTYLWKLSAEELVLVSHDVRRLCYWINYEVAPIAEKLMQREEEDEAVEEVDDKSTSNDRNTTIPSGRGIISDCLLEGSIKLAHVNSLCWQEIANQISSLCCEKLEAVKTVAGTFRMTNKPAPTTCSLFLSSILAPLKDFNDVFGMKAFDEEIAAASPAADESRRFDFVNGDGKRWKQIAVNKVSQRYCDIVSEVLTTARSMDDALKKRKKNTKGDSSNQGLSDAEKIGLQVHIYLRCTFFFFWI
jgi:conserved oligomeric Golgi complex subunit 2